MTTGTVSSSNLTSLYSNTTSFTAGVVNSSVYSVNGGTGVTVNPTTGNVVVNIGQDVSTSASVQFANVTATGNLSNNYYTLTNSVGIAGQVLTTDGLGVTTWTTPSSLGLVSSVSGTGAGISVSPTTGAVVVSNTGVTSIVAGTGISVSGATGAVTVNATGATYTINASSTTGGANLNLVGSDLTTDSVAYKGSGATTVTRTDANTITISSTAGTTIPSGTAQGQVLYWNGTAWVANSTITSAASGDRLNVVYNDSSGGVDSALFLRKNSQGTPYVTNDGVGLAFQLTSTSQPTNQYAILTSRWDPAVPAFEFITSIDSGANYLSAGYFDSAAATLPGWLYVNGGQIKTPAATGNLFNDTATTLNIGGDATTISMGNNPSTGLTTNKNAFYSFGDITTAGDLITINSDKTDVDVYLNFGRVAPGNNAAIRWNKTTDSFEWSADSTTYYDFINADLTAPFQNGQLLTYLNGEWINDNKVTVTIDDERNIFAYRPLSPTAGPNTSLYLRKDYSNAAPGTTGIGTYANGAGVSLTFAVQSDSQTPPGGSLGFQNAYANVTGVYSSTVPTVSLRTSINNGTNYTSVGNFSTTAATIAGTTLTLDANNVGVANNSSIIANRGSSGTDATLTWTEGTGFWTFNEDVFSSGEIISTTATGTNGQYITFNNENTSPSGTCYLLVKSGVSAGVDASIVWNDSTKRWQDTTDGSTFYNLPNQNLDTTSDVTFSQVTVDGVATINTQTTANYSSLTPVSISSTTRASQKAVIRIIDNVTGEIHMLEALAFYKGATAYLTTYAEMYSSAALATFTADVSAGSIRILATPASTNSTTFTVARTSLD